jgi:hypothetical protein
VKISLQKLPRCQRNIMGAFDFAEIKGHLLFNFFGFRRLNEIEITAVDLKDVFKEEESIEPISSLLEEVKQCIRAARQLILERKIHKAKSNLFD